VVMIPDYDLLGTIVVQLRVRVQLVPVHNILIDGCGLMWHHVALKM